MSAAHKVVPIRGRTPRVVPDEAYRAAISIHCPNADEQAMASRIALATLRDQASAGVYRCCDEAIPLLQAISSQAAVAVYAPLATRKLMALHSALNLTMMAARQLEWAVGLSDGR